MLLATRCNSLTHLDDAYTEGKITDETLVAVGQHLPQLRFFDASNTINKTTDCGIISVAKGCPQLDVLKVAFSRISWASLQMVPALLTAGSPRCHLCALRWGRRRRQSHAVLPFIRHVFVLRSSVSDGCVERLRQRYPQCRFHYGYGWEPAEFV